MIWLLLAHGVAALVAAPLVRRYSRTAILALALVPAAGFGWLLAVLATNGPDGPPLTWDAAWVPSLDLSLALRLDPIATILLLLVLGVGALVLVYSARYYDLRDRTLPTTIALLVAFTGTMAGLALADDLLLLFVFWELTTIWSYALIGGAGAHKANRRSAMEALIVTTSGGLAMLVGFLLLAYEAGTTSLSQIVADPPPASAMTLVALVLIIIGIATKSALIPWHFWLPAAMVAPTPVSAYLHAAAMVKAGVFLVARFTPAFADVAVWTGLLLTLGVATMLLGAYRALRQDDLKLLLAFGTVSQLGFLTALLGAGARTAALAGGAMLLAHGLFKACLFFVVGIIDHSAGTRDRRRLSGLGRRHRGLFVLATLAAASMAGVAPLAGFVAKEAALEAFVEPGTARSYGVLVLLVLGSALTAAYSARFLFGAFATKAGMSPTQTSPIPSLMWGPVAVLAGCGLVLGLAASVLDALVRPYADTVAALPGTQDYALKLWHGVGPALLLSAVAVGGGLALFAVGARVERWQARVPYVGDAEQLYRWSMRRLDALALRTTSATQRGSLPQYLAIILAVCVLGAGLNLVLALAEGGAPQLRLWDSPVQAVGAGIAVVGAVAAVLARSRIVGVVAAGTCGYGVAVLFVVHAAPDLALTQLLVETTTVIVAALVLRRLPRRFTSSQNRALPGPKTRSVLAVLTGLTLSVGGAVALAARSAEPVSADFAGPVYDFGGGKNIVNVTLVDLRAWDTLGEVSVLVVAATGVASLVFLRQRVRAPRRQPVADERRWLPSVAYLDEGRRSLVLELLVRLIFHTVVVLSIYLLFAGHNQPGGGFVGGLVAGLALVLRYVAGGRYELGAAAPLNSGVVLGVGLLIVVGTALGALVAGGQVLESTIWQVQVPLVGDVKFVTSLIFDVGVYLIVVGLVLDVLSSLGAQVDIHEVSGAGEADVPSGADPSGADVPSHTGQADVLTLPVAVPPGRLP